MQINSCLWDTQLVHHCCQCAGKVREELSFEVSIQQLFISLLFMHQLTTISC